MQRVSHRVLLAGIALCLWSPVVAQSWPQRPVSVVVPQPAGNSPDVLCRVVAAKLSQALGQQFIVENRAGAANLVGTQFVARAAPDGYTLLFATSAALVMNPYTFKQLPYDPIKDFTPVAMVARSNLIVLVNPDVKAKTLAELIALEKLAPGSLSMAVDGPRNLSGLIAQSINKQAGTSFVLVPYNTTTNAVQDSITGRVQATIQSASIAEAFIAAGALRPVAVAGSRRIVCASTNSHCSGVKVLGGLSLWSRTTSVAWSLAALTRGNDSFACVVVLLLKRNSSQTFWVIGAPASSAVGT